MAKSKRRRASSKGDTSAAATREGPRPFWSGTISFGLVSVPVDVYPATRSAGVALRMLGPDGAPLQRRYFDPEKGSDVAYENLVRGYAVDEDSHVPLTDAELESIAPRKSRDIDLRLFVDADEIDPMHFERAYVLTPAGDTTKPYRLLAEVMEREHKAGIATAVMRNKEYLIAITAQAGILRATTLRFAAEIRSAKMVGLPKLHTPPPKLVTKFEQAIRASAKPSFAPAILVDQREVKLRELVERKRRRGKDVVEAPMVDDDEAEPDTSGEDLFETIRLSLVSARRPSARGAGAKVARAPRRTKKVAPRSKSKPRSSR